MYANHTQGLSIDKTHKQGNYHKRSCTGPIGQLVASQILARSHTLGEIDHEIMSKVIPLLPLIQEGLFSVTSESMCMKYWLTI